MCILMKVQKDKEVLEFRIADFLVFFLNRKDTHFASILRQSDVSEQLWNNDRKFVCLDQWFSTFFSFVVHFLLHKSSVAH